METVMNTKKLLSRANTWQQRQSQYYLFIKCQGSGRKLHNKFDKIRTRDNFLSPNYFNNFPPFIVYKLLLSRTRKRMEADCKQLICHCQLESVYVAARRSEYYAPEYDTVWQLRLSSIINRFVTLQMFIPPFTHLLRLRKKTCLLPSIVDTKSGYIRN